METEGAVNTRAQIESELARVQRALALTEEARRRAELKRGAAQEASAAAREACKKAEEENNHLADEKLSLVIEFGALKDDFVAFWEKAAADREAIDDEFDSSGDTLFNYGYGCCAFTHNICGSKPQIPDGMPSPSIPLTEKFFANPLYPPTPPPPPPPPPQARRLLLMLWLLLLLVGRSVRRIVHLRSERRQFSQLIFRLSSV